MIAHRSKVWIWARWVFWMGRIFSELVGNFRQSYVILIVLMEVIFFFKKKKTKTEIVSWCFPWGTNFPNSISCFRCFNCGWPNPAHYSLGARFVHVIDWIPTIFKILIFKSVLIIKKQRWKFKMTIE